MLELMFCSLFTIVPDYLYRRYRQGKRFGKEITLFSVWFELRWGITGCVILAILLITTVFYNHPSTTNVTLFFRTVPIVPETIGRVAEIHVGMSGEVKAGQPIFRLDSSKQEAAVETARRKITEVDAEMTVARADVQKADSQVEQAKSVYQQTTDELETKQELYRRNPGNVAFREIERLQTRQQGDLAGGDVLVARVRELLRLGQVDPQLQAVEEAAAHNEVLGRGLDVQDAGARRHPLRVPVRDQATAAVGVLVRELAVDHVRDGLEAAVGVPRSALGFAWGVLDLAHLVHVDERVEGALADAGERTAHRKALTLEPGRRRGHGEHAADLRVGSRVRDARQGQGIVDGHGGHDGGSFQRGDVVEV